MTITDKERRKISSETSREYAEADKMAKAIAAALIVQAVNIGACWTIKPWAERSPQDDEYLGSRVRLHLLQFADQLERGVV